MYNKWIEKGLKKGLSDIQIFANERKSLSLEVYQNKLEKNEISKMEIAVIKGIYEGKMATVSVENFSEEHIDHMLDQLIDSAKNITSKEPALIYEGSKNYPKIDDKVFDFTKVDVETKINLLLDIEKGIKKNELVKNMDGVSYSESESKTIIVNSKGLNLKRHNSYAVLYAIGVYEKDGQTKTGVSYQIVKDFKDFNKDKLIAENIKKGTDQLGATSIKSGKYPVIFSNEMFANIINVYSGIFSGEVAYRNLTKLKDKQNTKIAADIVNLIDDPLHDESLIKVPFDDEGVVCKKRYWIKDGKFTDFSHNLKTAEIFKTKSTGNGFTHGISPTNLYLEPGNKSLEEVLENTNNGIYITNLVGLHAGVETVSGNFSLQASGFEIKDGKLVRPVDMIVVSGNFFEMLYDITEIANDFKYTLSGTGSAAVKIKSLTIGGQ